MMLFVRKEIAIFVKRVEQFPEAFVLRGDRLICTRTEVILEMNDSEGRRVYRFAGRPAHYLGYFEWKALKKAFNKFKCKKSLKDEAEWLASINPKVYENE